MNTNVGIKLGLDNPVIVSSKFKLQINLRSKSVLNNLNELKYLSKLNNPSDLYNVLSLFN